jgi:hypothetical protein
MIKNTTICVLPYRDSVILLGKDVAFILDLEKVILDVIPPNESSFLRDRLDFTLQ